MGEAIMASVGRSGVLPSIKKKLQTRIFTTNGTFVVPGNIVNNELRVMCYGGGGGSYGGGGGGGGWMNQKVFRNIPSQTLININIGTGGSSNKAGGSTIFGNYLSANGGSAGTVYRISVGQVYDISCGGSGGSGGGGGGRVTYGRSTKFSTGGKGYCFGGGGAGSSYCLVSTEETTNPIIGKIVLSRFNYNSGSGYHNRKFANECIGGDGGKYGGGGGGGAFSYQYLASSKTLEIEVGRPGAGGIYGGDGGYCSNDGNDGHYITENKIINDRSIDLLNNPSKGFTLNSIGGGGGGGYGGAGGNSDIINYCITSNLKSSYSSDYNTYKGILFSGSGGGGGYGANGGNGALSKGGYYSSVDSLEGGGGGGGGGYGGKGADAINNGGGGGGGYGYSNYGAGGGGTAINGDSGKSGICIVQYYEMVME